MNEAALLLQKCMENAAELLGMYLISLFYQYSKNKLNLIKLQHRVSVPLHVKIKVGRTWGTLEPFQAKVDQESHP